MTANRIRSAARWAAVPLAAAAVAAAMAAFAALATEPVYRATATLLVAPSSRVESVADELRALETLERRSILATMSRIPATPEVRTRVAASLQLPESELRRYSIRGTVQPYASVLTLDVEGPEAERAAAIANAAARITHDRLRRIWSLFSARTLVPAAVPAKPVRPDPGRDAAVAGLLGLFVGGLALAAWTALRSRGAS